MKNLISTLTLLFSFSALAQVTPIIGARYTGGLSYNLDHEYKSIEAGIYVNLEHKNFYALDGYYATAELLQDNTTLYSSADENNATIFRLTNVKSVDGGLAFTYSFGMGFTLEKEPSPITQFGIGLVTYNLPANAGVNFENLAGQNHLSVFVNIHLNQVFKKKK